MRERAKMAEATEYTLTGFLEHMKVEVKSTKGPKDIVIDNAEDMKKFTETNKGHGEYNWSKMLMKQLVEHASRDNLSKLDAFKELPKSKQDRKVYAELTNRGRARINKIIEFAKKILPIEEKKEEEVEEEDDDRGFIRGKRKGKGKGKGAAAKRPVPKAKAPLEEDEQEEEQEEEEPQSNRKRSAAAAGEQEEQDEEVQVVEDEQEDEEPLLKRKRSAAAAGSLQSREKAHDPELEVLRAKLESMTKVHAAELESMTKVHAAELESMTKVHAAELESMAKVHAAKLSAAEGEKVAATEREAKAEAREARALSKLHDLSDRLVENQLAKK